VGWRRLIVPQACRVPRERRGLSGRPAQIMRRIMRAGVRRYQRPHFTTRIRPAAISRSR